MQVVKCLYFYVAVIFVKCSAFYKVPQNTNYNMHLRDSYFSSFSHHGFGVFLGCLTAASHGSLFLIMKLC